MSITVPTLASVEATLSTAFYTQTEFPGLTRRFVDAKHPAASDTGPGTSSHPYRTLGPVVSVSPGTIIFINSGTYAVPAGGLSVVGGGIGSPAIITGYPRSPRPILDARPYSTTTSTYPATAAEIRVRQIIDVSGSNVLIQHLQLQYGFRHNVVFRGHYGVLRDCVLIGAFEDSIKVANTVGDFTGADYGLIENNDVSKFASQGVDLFGGSYWMIRNNFFHNPISDPITGNDVANAIGIKGGGDTYVVTSNKIYNMEGDPERGAIVLGGAGEITEYRTDGLGGYLHSCTGATVMANTFCGYAGPAISLPSAKNCNLYQNSIKTGFGFTQLGLDPDTRASDPNASALPYCSGTQVAENDYAAKGTVSYIYDVFSNDLTGFVSERNTYRVSTQCVRNGTPMSWAAFVALVGTDSTSTLS